jgi:5-methylcytosine-specific restriction endonuclease McrA
MNYADKLKDPRWQRKRLEILQRDQFKCFWCWNDSLTLHVHHDAYEGANPWETSDDLLTTLCEDCHSINHIGLTPLEKVLLDALRFRERGNLQMIRMINNQVKTLKSKVRG